MTSRSRRLRLHIAASRLHRWLALLIGFQLLLWFSSGLVMSLLPIERVRGEHLVDRAHVEPLGDPVRFAPAAALARAAGAPLARIDYHSRAGQSVADVTLADGTVRRFDAVTARPLAPLGADAAARIAVAAYRGRASATPAVEQVTTPSTDFRGKLPAWRVTFADADGTRVYVDDSGHIAAVRTDTWRFYDFFWSLHIMDWTEHERFNTWWLKIFATGGLMIALAGTVLLYLRWPRRRQG